MKACNPEGKRTGNADLRNCFRRPTNLYLVFSVPIMYLCFSVQYSPSCPFSNMRTWKQLVIEAPFLFFVCWFLTCLTLSHAVPFFATHDKPRVCSMHQG